MFLFGSSYDSGIQLSMLLAFATMLFTAMPLHNFVKALVSDALGSTLARQNGYISLDPRVQFDPRGTFALVLFGFGWPQPIPTDFNLSNSKKPKIAELIVGISGILTYLIIGIVTLFIFIFIIDSSAPELLTKNYFNAAILSLEPENLSGGFNNLLSFLSQFCVLNISHAVFNLVFPFRPLDAHNIFVETLPISITSRFTRFTRDHEGLATILLLIFLYFFFARILLYFTSHIIGFFFDLIIMLPFF